MRISFNQKYQINLAAINKAQERLQLATTRMDNQSKILSPADDPSGSARVVTLDQQINQTEQYQNNSITLKNNLGIAETVLTSIRTSMDQARTLTVSLGNGAFSQLDRTAVSNQLGNIRSQLFDLMNQQDSSGAFLFSGFQSQKQPFSLDTSTGRYVYNGDDGQKSIQVSPSVAIASNDSGKTVFEDVDTRYQTTAFTPSGGVTSAKARMQNQSVFDNFFRSNYDSTTPANNNYTVELTGATSYEIRRNGAALVPPVTGTYTSGQPINFQGLSITLEGTSPGQAAFSLQPPAKSNILNTLTDLINTVESGATGEALATRVADVLNQIDGASLRVDATISAIGGRQNVLDNVFGGNEDLQITTKSYKAEIAELDYAEAITEVTKQETALQAVQATFNRVTGTTLFDYIR